MDSARFDSSKETWCFPHQGIGFGYYVEDGHHRVAAAAVEVGQIEIDAAVTECLPLDDFKLAAGHRERLRF
jgi:hypothetical protein